MKLKGGAGDHRNATVERGGRIIAMTIIETLVEPSGDTFLHCYRKASISLLS